MPWTHIAYSFRDKGWEGLALLFSELNSGLIIVTLGIIAVLVIAQIGALIFVLVYPMKNEPEFNYLHIDQSGLNFVRRGRSRFWAWNELSGFRLVSRFTRIEFVLPGADLEAAKRDPWVHGITPHGPSVVIKDVYDTSLDEIVTTLNAYRQRAIE